MTSTKWKAPENFVSMANTFHRVDENTESTDTDASELWLVQVPQGFDVSSLNKMDSNVLAMSGSTQTLKVKTEQSKKNYSVAAFRDSPDCQAMNTVVTNASGQTVLGREVSHMLVVTETSAPCGWRTDSDSPLLAPRPPVPMPTGLRARYTPFGADTPCPSVSGKLKKSKKRSSKGEESMEEEEASQDTKKSSKKRKREAQEEDATEAYRDSKRRKRETDHDSCDEPTPSKKKKKKSKHRDSETMDVHNGGVGDGGDNSVNVMESSNTEAAAAGETDPSLNNVSQSPTSSSKKKKKSKRSHSEPLHNGDGDGESSLSITESPAVPAKEETDHAASFTVTSQSPTPKKKKKKSRTSEGAVEWDSADGGNLFMLDTSGDRTQLEEEDQHSASDEHSHSKHKKSKKKKKKHRQSM